MLQARLFCVFAFFALLYCYFGVLFSPFRVPNFTHAFSSLKLLWIWGRREGVSLIVFFLFFPVSDIFSSKDIRLGPSGLFCSQMSVVVLRTKPNKFTGYNCA
jgi:hypothetical protein